MNKFIHTILFLSLICGFVTAQNIGEIGSAKWFSARGYISAGYSNISSDNQALKNLSSNIFNMSAGVNISLKGLQIPLNFLYSSDQGSAFSTRQISRFGISPRYKWVKLYLGQNSLSFSPYVYSGTTFNGLGIELTPGKFRFAAFTGDLDQSFIAPTTQGLIIRDDIAMYDRKAIGLKMGFGSLSNYVDLYAFKAKDEQQADIIDSLRTLGITPGDNLALGFKTKWTIKNALSFELNAASSFVTTDQEGLPATNDTESLALIERFESVLVVNSSSRYALAYDARLGIDKSSFGIGLKYQHIDPLYNSFGINFINDDLDNYFIDFRLNLFKSAFNIYANYGFEFNNTKDYFSLSESRNIGSLNLDWRLSNRLSLGANFNNFSTSNQVKAVELNDTIALASVSYSLGANASYRIGDKKNPKSLSLSYAANTFEFRELETVSSSSDTRAINLNWRQKFKGPNLDYGLGVNLSNFTTSDTIQIGRRGVNLRLGKTIAKVFRIGVTAQLLQNSTNETQDGNVFNLGFNASSSFKSGYNLSFFSRYVLRNTAVLDPINTLNSRVQLKKSF